MNRQRQIYEIKEDDWKKLSELSTRARNTPVIYTPSGQKFQEVKSWSDYAYDNVYDAWKAIGIEYGFDGTDIEPVSEFERKISAYPLAAPAKD